MNVKVFENEKFVIDYHIILQGLNYQPTEDELIAQAKKNLLEDGYCTENNINEFKFIISE